ncbi:MAG: LptA/OstA family protein [Terriglobia bacterium]
MKKTPLELQEKRYDERRRGIKRLLGLVLFVTVTVVFLGLWASIRRRDRVVDVPSSLPKNVSRQLSGYTFTRSEEGRQIFTIHAARTLGYEGARTVLEGVHVIIYGRAGTRHDEITTDRCEYDNRTGGLTCSGRARVELQLQPDVPDVPDIKVKPGLSSLDTRQPLILETSNVSYDPSRSTVETPDAVNFHMGAATGSADGLVYNTRSDSLTLRKNVSLNVPGRAGGTGSGGRADPIRMLAGGIIYSKRANQIRLNSPVSLTQGARTIGAVTGVIVLNAQNQVSRLALAGVRAGDRLSSGEVKGVADHFEADLDPATSQVRALSASGHVEIEDRQGNGGWRQLTAGSVTLAMAGASSKTQSQPQSAIAQGHVKLVFNPAQGRTRTAPAFGPAKRLAPGERVLTAPKIFLAFQHSSLLQEAHTLGHSELQLIPTDRRLDRQTLTAGNLQMAFDAEGRLEAIQGSSSTRIVDQPSPLMPGGGLPRISSADNLVAQMDPATGVLTSIQQKGHYNFEQGSCRASADEALYEDGKQRLTLSGSPEVWDPQGRIRAQHMRVNLGAGVAEGWGKVQSIYFDAAPQRGPAQAAPKRKAQDGTPVIVLADRVTVDKLRQTAHYQGNVRAWRGADVVESSSLQIDRKQRRLSSGHGVVTSLLQPGAPPGVQPHGRPAPKGASQPVTIRADRLDYFDLRREAVYEGNVRMASANTTFQSNRLEVYFSKPSGVSGSGSPEIERAIAEGNVLVTQPPGRRAMGQHAEYFAAAGKIVLTGGPPVVYDQQQGYLSGKRLTFFIRDASLLADGENKSQTVSKRRILKQ